MYIYIFSNFGGLCTSPQKKMNLQYPYTPLRYFIFEKGVGLSKIKLKKHILPLIQFDKGCKFDK